MLNVAEDSPPVGHRCGFLPRMHGQVGSPRATGNLHVPSSSPRPGFSSGVRSVEAYISGPMELPPHIYAPDSFTQTLMTNIKCLCFNSEGYFKSDGLGRGIYAKIWLKGILNTGCQYCKIISKEKKKIQSIHNKNQETSDRIHLRVSLAHS